LRLDTRYLPRALSLPTARPVDCCVYLGFHLSGGLCECFT
jgi:hypothetical protein